MQNVPGALDREDALAGVPVGFRVFQDVLEPDAAIRRELRVLRASQAKYFTSTRVAERVPQRHTLAYPVRPRVLWVPEILATFFRKFWTGRPADLNPLSSPRQG
jgi:hypothetical protein